MRNRFAKSAFVVLLLTKFSLFVFAQQPCELSSKSAPLLLNLKIGMSPEQAQTIFGKDLKIKIKKNGERTIFQNYVKNSAPNSLNGVRALYLRFFDKKLYQAEIFYEPRTDLKTMEEVINSLSLQLNLPASNWQTANGQAELRCGEISLTVNNVLNPRIELTDEAARERVLERREKKSKR